MYAHMEDAGDPIKLFFFDKPIKLVCQVMWKSHSCGFIKKGSES